MKVRKIGKALLTLTPLLLCAGAAWASNSGVPQIDVPLNAMGGVARACGYIVGGIGAIGVIHHIRSGSWLGCAEHLGLTTFGGAIVYNYPLLAPIFGGTGAALVHSTINHPAAHLVAHAAVRLVS